MPLVFAGAISHGPGITGRAELADKGIREELYKSMGDLRVRMLDTRPDALIIVAAEHFANFFFDNMPPYCMGMADEYEGPIEDEEWLGITRTIVPGNPDLSGRLVRSIMDDIDIAYAQEWKFDHGISVPLHFLTPDYDLPVIPVNINCQCPPLTPLHRAYDFGRALRRACDSVPERIALVATGGISHWPCTPESGKINEEWDREFLDRFIRNDREQMISYTDEETYRDAGQGGFEIRTFITVAGATEGSKGELIIYTPIPIFAVGCTVATMAVN